MQNTAPWRLGKEFNLNSTNSKKHVFKIFVKIPFLMDNILVAEIGKIYGCILLDIHQFSPTTTERAISAQDISHSVSVEKPPLCKELWCIFVLMIGLTKRNNTWSIICGFKELMVSSRRFLWSDKMNRTFNKRGLVESGLFFLIFQTSLVRH